LRDLWPDSSTLYATIVPGHVQDLDPETTAVTAAGVMRLRPFDVARQLVSFRTRATTRHARHHTRTRFVGFVASELRTVYMAPDASDGHR